MNDTLSKNLNLPIIGGEIEAFFVVRDWDKAEQVFLIENPAARMRWWFQCQDAFTAYLSAHREFLDIDWRLNFISNGPDARFNAGAAYISSANFPLFYDALKLALTKLQTLSSTSFAGVYNKIIWRTGHQFPGSIWRTRQSVFTILVPK
jgi:hypothetical protein